jgi:putative ABC transport system permease protein
MPAPPESPSGHRVASRSVHQGYFDLFDAGLLAGRRFEPGDLRDGASAVIVNEAFVRRVLGGGNALGHRIRHVGAPEAAASGDPGPERWYEIVGLVEDLQVNRMDPALVEPALFHPVAPGQAREVSLAVRLRGATPADFGPRLRAITAAVDPSLRLRAVRSLAEENVDDTIAAGGVGALVGLTLLVVFLLSAAGVYALMSLTLTQRRREIGIRSALGASAPQLLRSVFTRAASQVALGLAVGVVVAVLAEGMTGGQLMGGKGAVILPALAVAMTVVGLLAALGPARRGLQIQPMEALRE